MNKKIKLIISCIIVLITISVSIIISISKEKVLKSDTPVSGLAIYVYNNTTSNYVSQSSVPTGNYALNSEISHCIHGGKILGYNKSTGTVNYSFKGEDRCYLYFEIPMTSGQNAATTIINSYNNGATNIATDVHGSYTNYRFIGTNPNNFACFDDGSGGCINYDKDDAENKPAGLFRIIGVFNEDTHGQSGKQLVKVISADKIGASYVAFDAKYTGIGSSSSKTYNGYGSADWSDAQLMYMLNGYVASSNHSGYSYNGSTYYITDGTYNIYQLYQGKSYLTGNGITTLNIPYIGGTSGYEAVTSLNMQTLLSSQANMIATVTWHLGASTYESVTASSFYDNERGTEVYSSRPTTWTGKIGLMYPSDWAYATSERTQCINESLDSWTSIIAATEDECEKIVINGGVVEYYYYGSQEDFEYDLENYHDGSYCSVARGFDLLFNYDTNDPVKAIPCLNNNWLVFTDTRSGTKGVIDHVWTITPLIDYDDIIEFTNGSFINTAEASYQKSARPSFYLNSNVTISGGTGTSTDPYRFSS